jgi:hypothetical protein
VPIIGRSAQAGGTLAEPARQQLGRSSDAPHHRDGSQAVTAVNAPLNSRRGFSAYHPLWKIGLLLLAIVATSCLIQAVAWLVGLEFSLLSFNRGARTTLLMLSLVYVLVMMQADGRSAAQLGLAMGEGWSRRWLKGLAIGALTYAAYFAAAWGMGAIDVSFHTISPARVVLALFASLTAVPVAAVQSIIFNGYVHSIVRDRYSPTLAILIAAGLTVLFGGLSMVSVVGQASTQQLLIGLYLVSVLMGFLRLRSGNIVFAAGLLTGWLMIRRSHRSLSLLVAVPDSPWQSWLAPQGDFRQAPVVWALLGAAIAATVWQVRRYGEAALPENARSVSRGFKRVLPFSNVLAMAPLDLWLSRLADARFRVEWLYLPRLVAVLCISAANTLLTLPERLLAPLLLRHRIPDPIFIVGVHRSGTTHLHNLLALDPQLCAPRNLHTVNPLGMLTTGWLLTPILGAFMTWRRPMDAVRLNLLTPQEEELAIAGMCPVSPYWAFTFPRRIGAYHRLIFPDNLSAAERAVWQHCLRLFLRKLTFWNRRRPVLKSPYNTARVAALRAMFPKAKFIHLCRHPCSVYRSNVHAAREGWIVFQLHDPDPQDSYETRFLENYRALEDAFYRDAASLPKQDVAELRFEDLERDPIAEIRRLYAQLGLTFDQRFGQRLQAYLGTLGGYRKNRFAQLTPEVSQEVETALGEYFDRWGYERSRTTLSTDEADSQAPRKAA